MNTIGHATQIVLTSLAHTGAPTCDTFESNSVVFLAKMAVKCSFQSVYTEDR